MFQNNLLLPSTRVNQSHLQGSWTAWPLKMGKTSCPETLVTNYHYMQGNNPDEFRFQTTQCYSWQGNKCLAILFTGILVVTTSQPDIFPTRCNITQFIYFWNCSTCFGWYLHPPSGGCRKCIDHPQHTQTSSNSSTIAAGSNYSLTSARCCRYSCVCSWWWVAIETCRAVSRYK